MPPATTRGEEGEELIPTPVPVAVLAPQPHSRRAVTAPHGTNRARGTRTKPPGGSGAGAAGGERSGRAPAGPSACGTGCAGGTAGEAEITSSKRCTYGACCSRYATRRSRSPEKAASRQRLSKPEGKCSLRSGAGRQREALGEQDAPRSWHLHFLAQLQRTGSYHSLI